MQSTIATNLSRARSRMGLSMEHLANIANCSKQAISYYENGHRTPDSQTLLKFSNIFGVEPDYFYTSQVVKFSLNDINYREGGSLSQSQRNEVETLTASKLSDYLELEIIAKEVIEFQNPIEDLTIQNTNDAEKAAKQLRKKWKLGEGPISNISNLLEKNGVRIIKIDFGFNYNHAGLSGWAENKTIPVIVVNDSQKDISRRRFTILHELGHLLLIMHKSLDIETIERICDAFAGAVLLPYETLIQEFGRNRTAITMSELIRIKELYGISIKAIMVRANVIQLISYEAYAKWKEYYFSHSDYGQYFGAEEPQKFTQMLYRCLSEKKIGFDKAAKLSYKAEEELRQEYIQQQLEFI